MKKKILFIGFPNSIHVENWIENINKKNNEIIFFPSTFRQISNKIKKKTDYLERKSYIGFLISLLDIKKLFFDYKVYIKQLGICSFDLLKIINKYKPNIIHALEFQHSGYLLIDIYKKINYENYKIFISNYGSDTYYFGKISKHNKKITKLLSFSDLCISESKRDIKTIKKINPKIKQKMIPNSGGFKKQLKYLKTSSRKCVVIKGYNSQFGRLNLILTYLKKNKNIFKKIPLYFYSVDRITQFILNLKLYNFDYTVIANSNKSDLMKFFSKSKIYIGASISDGMSTSALDAVNHRTLPLQSDSSSINEIVDNKFIYNLYDENDFIKKFVFLYNLKKKADIFSEKNYNNLMKIFDKEKVKKEINILYRDYYKF